MTTKTNGALAPITIADALNKTLETPSLDPILLSVANEFLGGTDISEIAGKFDISTDRVTQIVEKKEVKSYIDNTILNFVVVTQSTRKGLAELFCNVNKGMTLNNQEKRNAIPCKFHHSSFHIA